MKMLFIISIFFSITSLAQNKIDSNQVYFSLDKSFLSNQAKESIIQFAEAYKTNKFSQIMISGHCDGLGTDIYNDRLSEKRVQSVYDFLIRNGVPAEAIVKKKGYGKRMPLNDNGNAEERQVNRRVELIWQIAGESNQTGKVSVPDTASREFSKERMNEAREGQTLVLKNINFYGGRHSFLPRSLPALQELLDVMNANPDLVIEIQGHICCRIGLTDDGEDYDAGGEKRLSINRAKAVMDFLESNGISRDRMSYKGFAGTQPLVNPELTEDDRTANRRVEIRIVKK